MKSVGSTGGICKLESQKFPILQKKEMGNRFLIYCIKGLAAIGLLGIFALSVAVMLYGMVETVHAAGGILQNQHSEKDIIVIVVGIVDFFLLGITALLVAVGLYELFFKPIAGLPDWINIKNMDQLKVMLITVAILVMSISFMGKVVTWNGEDDIMGYGVALGLVIIGLSYFLSIKQQKES